MENENSGGFWKYFTQFADLGTKTFQVNKAADAVEQDAAARRKLAKAEQATANVWKQYLPWIIGGAVLLGIGAFFLRGR